MIELEDFLRPAIQSEFNVVRRTHFDGGVYAGFTNTITAYTCWADKKNDIPACAIQTSLADPRFPTRFWVNPDLLPRGV